MYRRCDIRKIHLELTSLCNASCPQCSRNTAGGAVIENLPLTQLSIADVQTILPADFVAQLETIQFCGTYGDAILARDLIECLEYFRECSPTVRIELETNGGVRAPAWWSRLAKLVTCCNFGIDGLADTHALYRRGTDFHRVLENASSFIQAGGDATWVFLVFHHNEHQVDQARRLSEELGFRRFRVRRTARFASGESVAQRMAVVNRRGEFEYYLELPINDEYRNPGLVELRVAGDDSGAGRHRKDGLDGPIQCKAIQRAGLYISAEGLVFPCCWTAGIYESSKSWDRTEIGRRLAGLQLGRDEINALKRPIEDILAGPFYSDVLPSGWIPGSASRLRVCANHCGPLDRNVHQYAG